MPKLPYFDPPGNQNDFQGQEQAQEKVFRDRWNDNMNRFTEQTLENDPWSSSNQPYLTQYYNPLNTDLPAGLKGAAIQWTAFPNRILITYPSIGQNNQWKYADEGPPPDDKYGPGGARGWQDEYCEWSVSRNAAGKIVKVMFTCENREYWYTLWEADPNVVLRIYQQLVGAAVKLENLYLIVRGRKIQAGKTIDYILHAVYEVPAELGLTVGDISIDGFNIEYGAQIAQTFQIALAALPLPPVNPPQEFLCAGAPVRALPRSRHGQTACQWY